MEPAQGFSLVLIGATGLVGRAVLSVLEERRFPISKLTLLASQRSKGKSILFQGKRHVVQSMDSFSNFTQEIAIFAAGSQVAKAYVPKFQKMGALVVDNSSYFRYEKEVPLVIPELNSKELLQRVKGKGFLVASPNCATTTALLPLGAIHQSLGIESLEITSLQAVSGSGQKGLLALEEEKKKEGRSETSPYQNRIEGNLYPLIDVMMDNGFTKEEMKIQWETQKILGESIQVNATCIRVPVAYGHTLVVHAKLKKEASLAEKKDLMSLVDSVVLLGDEPKEVATPYLCSKNNTNETFVSRVRHSEIYQKRGLSFISISDSLRKGAALNNVQIIEIMNELTKL